MNPVRWFEIYVNDMPRAKVFYENVFSVKLSKLDAPITEPIEMWGFPMDPKASGCSGSLVKMEGISPSGVSTIIYFASEDCSVEEKRVAKFGGKIDKSKMSIGQYGFISLVVDTEGNRVGIHSMK